MSVKKKGRKVSSPVCKVCGQSGAGVQFKIFDSSFPFGDCCVECEDKKIPEALRWLGEDPRRVKDCDLCESGQVYLGLIEVVPARRGNEDERVKF